MPFAEVRLYVKLIHADEGEKLLGFLQDRLDSFKFEDEERKIDQATLRLRNTDFRLLDEPAFVKGQRLRVQWGYYDEMSAPRDVIVQKVSGTDPITIKARSPVILMDRKPRRRIWSWTTHSDIAIQIAREYGYEGELLHVDDTSGIVYHEVIQRVSDMQFLAKLAKRNGFIFYIDHLGFHFHTRPVELAPTRTYTYSVDRGQGDMLDLPKIKANLTKGVTRVRTLARDPVTKEWVEAFGSSKDTEFTALGKEEEDGDPDNYLGERQIRVTRQVDRPIFLMPTAEAKMRADARWRTTAEGRYKISFNALGHPEMGAKQVIDVLGLGDTWSGNYYLKKVVTNIKPGEFTQELTGKKIALDKVATINARTLKQNINDSSGGPIGRLTKHLVPIRDGSDSLVLGWIWEDSEGNQQGKPKAITTADLQNIPKSKIEQWEKKGVEIPRTAGPE